MQADPANPDRVRLIYTELAGGERTVHAELRRAPGNNADIQPVLVWSHGGSEGRTDVAKVAERWGRVANEAGFAFVAIAHPGRTDASARLLCESLDAGSCDDFTTLLWDRPIDVSHVLDWVEAIADDRSLDASSIVYGGHSAGATAVFIVAGVDWKTTFTSPIPQRDGRPIAFVAASSPGAAARGLDPDQVAPIDRPILSLTGRGDDARTTTGPDRRATFELFTPDSPHLLLWLDDERATHSLFNLDTDSCEQAGGTMNQCRTAARMIATTASTWMQHVIDAADPTAPPPQALLRRLRADLATNAMLLTTDGS